MLPAASSTAGDVSAFMRTAVWKTNSKGRQYVS